MSLDLTNQKVSESYQRLIQVALVNDFTQLFDGTGSNIDQVVFNNFVSTSDFYGSGQNITNLTASNISNFDTDISKSVSDSGFGNFSTDGTGIFSSSNQVNYTLINNIPNGLISQSQLAVANGIATLDSGSKIPLSQIPDSVVGGVNYLGTWDASTNTPTLSNATGSNGNYYKVNTPGAVDFGSGSIIFSIGDWAIYGGNAWEKIDQTEQVTSVNSKTGAVTLFKSDIGLSNVDNTSDLNKPISNATSASLANKLNIIGDGVFSSSNQVDYNNIQNIPTNLISQSQNNVILSGSFSGSFGGDGSNLTNLTASNISNFDTDVSASVAAYGFGGGIANLNGTNVISQSQDGVELTGSFSGSFIGDGSQLTGIELDTDGTGILSSSMIYPIIGSSLVNTGLHSLVVGASSSNETVHSLAIGNSNYNSLGQYGQYQYTFGNSNNNNGQHTTIFGSDNTNSNNTAYSLINGSNNELTGSYSFVVGGNNQVKSAIYSYTLGRENYNEGYYSLLVGYLNTGSSNYGITTGFINKNLGIANAVFGSENTVTNNYSIVGGSLNSNDAQNSLVIGKDNVNESLASFSMIVGNDNYNNGENSVIFGKNNSTNSVRNFIIGLNNISSASISTILNSENSEINSSAVGGTSLGGSNNEVSGAFSYVMGQYGQSIGDGELVHSSIYGGTPNVGRTQFKRVVLGERTTSATVTNLKYVSGYGGTSTTNGVKIKEDSINNFDIQVSARNISNNDGWVGNYRGAVKNNGGTLSLLGTVTEYNRANDSGASSWSVNIGVNSSDDTLRINVTGQASTTINWTATVNLTQVS